MNHGQADILKMASSGTGLQTRHPGRTAEGPRKLHQKSDQNHEPADFCQLAGAGRGEGHFQGVGPAADLEQVAYVSQEEPAFSWFLPVTKKGYVSIPMWYWFICSSYHIAISRETDTFFPSSYKYHPPPPPSIWAYTVFLTGAMHTP